MDEDTPRKHHWDKPGSAKWLKFGQRLPWPEDYFALAPRTSSPCCEEPLYVRNGKHNGPAKASQ